MAVGSLCKSLCLSYRFRRWLSIILEAGAITLTIFLIGFTAKSPTETFSWAKGSIQYSGDSISYYLGLQEMQGCAGQCLTIGYTGVFSECATAGSWVLACYILMIIFLLAPLVFLFNCGCFTPKWEKAITGFCLFAALTWSIIAIAQWYNVCMNAKSTAVFSLSSGYAIGLVIIIIVFLFLALIFHMSTLFFRPGEGAATPTGAGRSKGKKDAIADGYVPSDAYSPPASSQGNFSISHSGATVGSNNMYATPPVAQPGAYQPPGQTRAYGW